jgi:polysaccharide export outer membrane protein
MNLVKHLEIPKYQILRLLIACLLLASFCVAADKNPAPASDNTALAPSASSSAVTANSTDYVIGDGDSLAINVWHEQELSRVVPVRPDGKISLPLLGDMQATGLTPGKLQAKITEALRNLMENPEVTVIVQETLSKRFSVVGQVAKPGSYALNQRLMTLDAIALAGGFREFAKVGKMYVLRVNADGSSRRLPFNYKRALKGEGSENFPLQPGDTIVVP